MARPFSTSDAKRIAKEHQTILEKLNQANITLNKYYEDIETASEALAIQELLKILSDIPIDEINRDKRGFRLKALKDYGYNTVADVATVSVYTIASIYGISEDTAYLIKNATDEIVSKAYQGIKIHISVDNKTNETTQLVLTLAKYKQSEPLVEECNNLILQKNNKLKLQLKILLLLKTVLNGFLHPKLKDKKLQMLFIF